LGPKIFLEVEQLVPEIPGLILPGFGYGMVFCEAEQTLLASFSGKRRILNAEVLVIVLYIGASLILTHENASLS
jgi:predicted tellurium resistance membrane protein TerC